MQSMTLQGGGSEVPAPLPDPVEDGPVARLHVPASLSEVPPHRLGLPQRIEVEAFAVALGRGLDFAEGWDCKNGADCKNRAYAGEFFPTEAEARQGVRQYILERCAELFPSWSAERAYREMNRRDGLEHVHIVRVTGSVDACFDYREAGCEMAGAFDQLRRGEGRGAAWRLMRRHRNHYGARAVRLPGRTSEGFFFGFVTACTDLSMHSVAKVRAPEL
jgi:hypothetical protein